MGSNVRHKYVVSKWEGPCLWNLISVTWQLKVEEWQTKALQLQGTFPFSLDNSQKRTCSQSAQEESHDPNEFFLMLYICPLLIWQVLAAIFNSWSASVLWDFGEGHLLAEQLKD